MIQSTHISINPPTSSRKCNECTVASYSITDQEDSKPLGQFRHSYNYEYMCNLLVSANCHITFRSAADLAATTHH